jgi:NADPH-dependent 2,4-dienoyl-CoA reductase/sulfur reductase-like enzyme/rhodanese-related sulfurtransferase
MSDRKRILIVGGVAGGASCAARARRLSETAEIVMFDRGPYVSFANCGLPYYVGDVIKKEENLLVATPELFRQRFNIEVRLRSEVVSIDRDTRTIQVKDLENDVTYNEPYDALVLSPGAQPIRPALPGIDLPGIFSVRTIPESRMIRAWIEQYRVRQVVIVGGGYIGMEMAENLHRRDLKVSIVEKQAQVMPLLDPEMAAPIHSALIEHGVQLFLNDSVVRFEPGDGHRLVLSLQSGQTIETDLVILCIGVKPDTSLPTAAGLAIDPSGGIRVDAHMRTEDPHIWAVGDAVAVTDVISGRTGVVPLAGPANRQGRIAADTIMGRDSTFRGVQGTSVVGILDHVAAFTGLSEKALKKIGLWEQMEKVYLHPGHHAGYYPGAAPITLKLIFFRSDGRVVGAQAIGREGVEKRIDVIAMAMQKGATVFDLEEAELCYAPQFGSAKDPVNMAGMIAANVLRGDARISQWEDLETGDALILDVRDAGEYRRDHVEGAVHIPLDELRSRMNELPKDRPIWAYCFVGQRSYYAARMLTQYGYDVTNISGGFRSFLLREEVKYL